MNTKSIFLLSSFFIFSLTALGQGEEEELLALHERIEAARLPKIPGKVLDNALEVLELKVGTGKWTAAYGLWESVHKVDLTNSEFGKTYRKPKDYFMTLVCSDFHKDRKRRK